MIFFFFFFFCVRRLFPCDFSVLSIRCFVINLFEFTVPKKSINVESKKKNHLWIIILFSFHMHSLFAEKKKKKAGTQKGR